MVASIKTVNRGGKRFVLLEEREYHRLTALDLDDLPRLPRADADGNVPAAAYARATIARGIIRDRHTAGLSQAELARLSGVRVETLNRIERAKVTPDVRTILKIDRALKSAAGRTGRKRTRAESGMMSRATLPTRARTSRV